jgi:hypothetical protein
MGHSSLARIVLSAVAIATVLGGCTAMRRDRVPETTSLLTQAGFKVLKADTPERVAKLNTLTPYKVVPWKRKSGGTVYAYAEPDSCKCVYVGSPKQYTRYRQLLSAEQAAEIAAQQEAGAQSRRSSRIRPSKNDRRPPAQPARAHGVTRSPPMTGRASAP